MRTLYLGTAERRAIAGLRARAEAAPIAADAVAAQRAQRRRGAHVALPIAFTLALPDGFLVAFTIEPGPERHLVICGAQHPSQILMLLDEFGFSGPWRDLPMWLEQAGGGRGRAVHFAERLPPAPEALAELEMLVAPPEDGEEVDDDFAAEPEEEAA